MTTPTIPPGTRVGDLLAGGECPRCGTPYDRLQEYCLECGQRLTPEAGAGDALAAAVGRPSAWYAGDWVWPALVMLVVALITAAAAVAIAATRDDDDRPRLVVATSPIVPTLTGAPPIAPPTTAPSVTLPEEEAPVEPPPPPTPPPAAANEPITWPAGRNGFTVVLASVPASSRAAALQRARQAREAGLEEVGVLTSSRYPSLHPGYLVVFSGVYPTLASAQTASGVARQRGYADAYAAQVAR
jgi:hypothetical protein